ncbi:MAG: hypothetical protein ACI9UN_004455 [Granulosicoccus sp.]|jgi:hypothetical protein
MHRELSLSGGQKLWLRRIVSLLFTGALVSCAGNTVPSNAVLDITPRIHSVQVTERVDDTGGCVYAPENFMDIPLVLQLTTANGSPIGESPIHVYADFSENTYPGLAVLALYDDLNSNGVIDSEAELVSGLDDDIAEVRSGRYDGAKTLLLRVNLSCSFRGEIRAIAGGVSGSAVIEVTGTAIVTAGTGGSGSADDNVTARGLNLSVVSGGVL